MARANRYYIPGHVYHLTHRCHKKEFLLKFARDRKRWLYWLFEAKKRYGLSILNYMVTSNHVHLLVYDRGRQNVISNSMQLIASRTGQEYNLRKRRNGAFWEDRYHATAIEKNTHLQRCLVYIDLNMARAGVVDHPKMWPFSGFNEIQNPPRRYRIIDLDNLVRLAGFENIRNFQVAYKGWIEASLSDSNAGRQVYWSQNLAVGSRSYVANVKHQLGARGQHRTISGTDDQYQLREAIADFDGSSSDLLELDRSGDSAPHNSLPWRDGS